MAVKKLKIATPGKVSKALYVLFVDPEQKSQIEFNNFMAGMDYIGISVSDQESAIKFLEKDWFNTILVISEFNLSKGNALEFKKLVFKNWRQLPFVVCSQKFPANFNSLLAKDDTCHTLNKPFSKNDLEHAIKDVAGLRIEEVNLEREALVESFEKFTVMLDDMENLVLNLEDNPSDKESIQRIFGIIHTIKGSSSFLRSQILSDFCHMCEDAFEDIKSYKFGVNKSVVTVLLQVKDIIWEIMNAVSSGEDQALDIIEFAEIFKGIVFETGAEVAETAGETEPNSGKKQKKTQLSQHKTRDWLKVPRSNIEEFLKLNGEMTITKNMIDKFIKLEISQNLTRSKNMEQLAKLFEQFFKYQQDMQNKMHSLKKVSLAETFVQVRRDVRTLSERLGKPVNLVIDGESINVDDTLVESIFSSLVHIVRNSLDHGIESAEARKAAGKPVEGSVYIEAYDDDERVFIICKDDGRGIDPEKIRKSIVEKGQYSEADAAKFDSKTLINMIFKSGVSTAATVTDVSGRGIGLDMVFNSIIQRQGRVDVTSEVGKGTTFSISLPIPKSVIIFKSLVVSCGGSIYAIPQDHIAQVLSTTDGESLNNSSVQVVSGKNMLRLKSQNLPLFDLNNILNDKFNDHFNYDSTSTIVIIQGLEKSYGIMVDEVMGIEDTVVKTLEQISDLSPIYLGATIFGDGQVGMILNPNSITKMLTV